MEITSAEVVVIGGGVIGTSVTYSLAKQGMDVVLLDRADLGTGASTACGAAIMMQTKGTGLKLKLALESKKDFEHLSEELGEDIEYEQEGGMVIAETDEEIEHIKNLAHNQHATGLQVELLDRKEIRERQPALGESVVAATYCPHDGRVNPLKLNFAYGKAARRYGARISTFNGVTAIGLSKGRVSEVVTPTTRVKTECIVNAGGVWAPYIGEMVGLSIPVKPRRGILVVTEMLPPLIRGSILSAKYMTSKYGAGPDQRDGAVPQHFPGGLTIRHSRSGNLLFGSTREFVGYNTNTTFEGTHWIIHEAVRLVPQLQNVCVIRTFAGLRPFTSDSLPILGRVPGVDGFIMAAGHEGDGIALAPITGRLIANLVAKGECPEELSHLCIERFM